MQFKITSDSFEDVFVKDDGTLEKTQYDFDTIKIYLCDKNKGKLSTYNNVLWSLSYYKFSIMNSYKNCTTKREVFLLFALLQILLL